MPPPRRVVLSVNGLRVEVQDSPSARLIDVIRIETPWQGPKVGCGEGGCGACAVIAETLDPLTGAVSRRTLNACLAPVALLDGASLITSEGLGNCKDGFSAVQEAVATRFASQCGFCTPGVVVAMTAAAAEAAHNGNHSSSSERAAAIAAGLDGNLCRCTGWRPILDACRDVADLEDLGSLLPCCSSGSSAGGEQQCCSKSSSSCSGSIKKCSEGSCAGGRSRVTKGSSSSSAFPDWLKQYVAEQHAAQQQQQHPAGSIGQQWLVPSSLQELAYMLRASDTPPRLLAGNTGAGVFKDLWPHSSAAHTVVQLTHVREMRGVTYTSSGVVLGANVTLQQLLHVLRAPSQAGSGAAAAGAAPASTAAAWGAMADTIQRIAGGHVRSAATLGGHFGLCLSKPLPSDVAVVLAAAGAQLSILTVPGLQQQQCGSAANGWLPQQQQHQEALDVRWVPLEAFLQDSCIGCSGSSSRGSGGSGGSSCSGCSSGSDFVLSPQSVAGAKLAGLTLQQQQQQQGALIEPHQIAGGITIGSSAQQQPSLSWPPHAAPGAAAATRVVTAVWLPFADDACEAVRCDRVALRYVNSHALVNAALWLKFEPPAAAAAAAAGSNGRTVTGARLFVGFPSSEGGSGSGSGGGSNTGRSSNSSSSSSRQAALVEEPWQLRRVHAVESTLLGRQLDVQVLVSALRAWEGEAVAAGLAASCYAAQALQGLLFKALVSLLEQHHVATLQPHVQRLLQLPERHDPSRLPDGLQLLPSGAEQAAATGMAPVHLPVEKDAIRLQASGEAVYVADAAAALSSSSAYIAGVLSSEALATVDGIDTSAAEAAPGVLGVLTAADIPAAGSNSVYGTPLLADGLVEFVGQPIALVVATSQAAADAAAALVAVRYGAPPDGRQPIITLDQALQAGAFYSDLPLLSAAAVRPQLQQQQAGSSAAGAAAAPGCGVQQLPEQAAERVAQLIAAAPHRISGRYELPAQQHMYMETQVALAQPGEDGTVSVMSATQSLDAVQQAVAAVLGLPFHKVTVVTKRLGGAFGGKTSRSMPVAAAAALAATRFRRPVLWCLNRNDDLALNPGRCAGRLQYDVGFEPSGKLIALHASLLLRGGAYLDLSATDAAQLVHASDSAYDLAGLAVDVRLARCNLPPHTIMRGPGYLQGVMVLEQVLEHVAAVLGKDSADVKAANFLPDVSPPAAPNSSTSSSADASSSRCVAGRRPCAGSLHTFVQQEAERQAMAAAGAAEAAGASSAGGVTTTLGRLISSEDYTLPRLWQELLECSAYKERLAAAQEHNRKHAWSKRAVVVTPVRFDCAPASVSAAVSVYADGSVLLTHGGIEMGQGLSTKVKQAAVAALSLLLPEAQRPLPLSLVRVAASSSDVVPGGGPTWSSTGSEGNCAAVQLAALKIVNRLRPHVKVGCDGASTWAATLAGVNPDVGFAPASVLLSAYGYFDGTTRPDALNVLNAHGAITASSASSSSGGGGKVAVAYSAFCAGVSEVELDVLTGERRLLKCDIRYDCGFSLNPGIDLGQVEGGFVMGLGAMLSEEVVVDEATGRNTSATTWKYKVPTPDLIPGRLVVSFLDKTPNRRGVLSSKATGEPSLMASTSALLALQRAAAEAAAEVEALCCGVAPSGGATPWRVLTAPATPPRLRAVVGAFSIADALQAALAGGARSAA